MSKRTTLFGLLVLFVGIMGIVGIVGIVGKRGDAVVVRDTTTVTDTVPYFMPVATDSVRTKYITRYLPVVKRDTILAENFNPHNGDCLPPPLLSDDRDSTAVEIPITQKRYEGTDYCAYVSGYEASLDSIFVYARTTTIRERSTKPPDKWHIGVTAGYGFTTKGMQPYVGIGLTYSLISF